MRYAIIAAGEGSRLAEEGIRAPKPLVEVAGEKLMDRLLRIFVDCGATEVVVICNQLTTLVADHLRCIQAEGLANWHIPLRFIQKTTPSSMHSFHELAPLLAENAEPFVLTTVDTIFREEEFHNYVQAFSAAVNNGFDGLMGVTDYIDDEKPLYVGTDKELNITGFFDKDYEGSRYISGGIYGLTPKSLHTLQACVERKESRMRNFQRALVRDGLRLKAHPFSKVLDIDHATDIEKAESFLKNVNTGK